MAGEGRSAGGRQGSGACISGHAFSPDVQDMSLVTLSTRTPRDFFSHHQLVLHVAKSEMDKVRVFQASREWPGPSPPRSLPAAPRALPLPTRFGRQFLSPYCGRLPRPSQDSCLRRCLHPH